MRSNCTVYFVAVEGQHQSGVRGRSGESGAINLQIAFVYGLAKRNPGEGDNLRKDRCIHQNHGVRLPSQQRTQSSRNREVVRPARLDVLCAFDINHRTLAQHLSRIERYKSKQRGRRTAHPPRVDFAGLDFVYEMEHKLRQKTQPQSECRNISIP